MEEIEASGAVTVLDFHNWVSLDPDFGNVGQGGKPAYFGRLVDVVVAEVDFFQGQQPFETTDGLETVPREVQMQDLAELSVDAKHRVDHVVCEVKRDEVVEHG